MTPKELAKAIRIHALRMTSRGRSAHIGAVFSIAEILAVLYGKVMRIRPDDPAWEGRDRFILSKGHAGAGVYAALAETGHFPIKWLDTHCQDGSILSGHVSHKGIPGVEFSTGSLGHGLGIAVGMAKGLKLAGRSERVFVVLSDGECDEGSTWEAALFAGHHKLDNLVAIIDYNKIQSLASTTETLDLEPFGEKWSAFHWAVRETEGHDCTALGETLETLPFAPGAPSVVIAHTTKGKGVSFMENTVLWHYRTAVGDEYDAALAELEAAE